MTKFFGALFILTVKVTKIIKFQNLEKKQSNVLLFNNYK